MARPIWIHALPALLLLPVRSVLAQPAQTEATDVAVESPGVEAEPADPAESAGSGADATDRAAEPERAGTVDVAAEPPTAVPVSLAAMRPYPVRLPQITDPAYRDLRFSAYTLPARTFSFGTKLLGLTTDEMIASLSLDYGLGKGVQLGVNVAHMGVGLLNLSGKWTFVEKGPFAFSVGFDPIYVHGDWVWLARMKQLFAGIDTVLLPFQVSGSVFATPWLQFDLSARYMAGFIVGNVSTARVTLDADLTAHEFALYPAARIHLLGRSTLTIAAALPLYRTAPAAANVEVELAPGVVAGGSLDGTKTKSLDQTYRIEVGVRSMVSRHIFFEFGLNFGAQVEFLYGSPVYPRLGMEARF